MNHLQGLYDILRPSPHHGAMKAESLGKRHGHQVFLLLSLPSNSNVQPYLIVVVKCQGAHTRSELGSKSLISLAIEREDCTDSRMGRQRAEKGPQMSMNGLQEAAWVRQRQS